MPAHPPTIDRVEHDVEDEAAGPGDGIRRRVVTAGDGDRGTDLGDGKFATGIPRPDVNRIPGAITDEFPNAGRGHVHGAAGTLAERPDDRAGEHQIGKEVVGRIEARRPDPEGRHAPAPGGRGEGRQRFGLPQPQRRLTPSLAATKHELPAFTGGGLSRRNSSHHAPIVPPTN